MKTLEITLKKEVQTKADAENITAVVRSRLADRPDIEVKALYWERDEILESA